jgi:ankyrin repeat protein
MEYTFLDTEENALVIEFASRIYEKDREYIKQHRADIPDDNLMKNELFLIAALFTDPLTIKLLVRLLDVKIDAHCLLHVLEYSEDLDVLNCLISDLGIDCQTVFEPYTIDNCLIIACRKNQNLDIIKYLIDECQMDLNVLNAMGENLIHAAAENQNPSIIKYLIEEREMSIRFKDKRNIGVLAKAIRAKNIQVIDYLKSIMD